MGTNRNGTFYILDFLKSLINAKKIPIIIHLIFDALFTFAGVIILMLMVVSHNITESAVIIALVVSVAVYFGAIVLLLSPVGGWVLRLKFKCDKIEEPEILNQNNTDF